ncbi:MAG: exosortase K [Candidatus Kapaibacterium sp.]
MKVHNNLPYYLAAIGLFLLLKFGYTFAGNDDMRFLLAPTDTVVGILTGSHSVYASDTGYYHSSLNILIEKSCSGFNFMLLCFGLLTFVLLRPTHRPARKSLSLPLALGISYLLTIFVNASRITTAILVQREANRFLSDRPHFLLHEIAGVLTHLTFLIIIYYTTDRLLTNRNSNAKPT